MFKVEIRDGFGVWRFASLPTPGSDGQAIIPYSRMTRKQARAYLKARKLRYPCEQLRIVNIGPVVTRCPSTKKYTVQMRCTRRDSAHQQWASMGKAPGTRQEARDYVADSKAYDERHRIFDWKYRIVEVDGE